MFSTLADHAPVGLFVSGEGGQSIFVNQRWCELAGIAADESVGMGWLRAIHPEDRDWVRLAWEEAVRTHKEFLVRFRFLHSNGNIVWVESSGSPVSNAKMGGEGYIGSCIAIGEQKSAEAKMRLYEAIFSTSPDFAYVFDTSYRFIYANPSLLNTWGLTWEQAAGKTCLEVGYEPWHAEMHAREIDEVVKTKQPLRGDIPFTGVNGRRIYDYIFTPVLNDKGEVEAVAGTTRDVTERKQAEERADFLSYLTGKLALLTSEEDILRTTTETVGRHLNCHRCYFVECLKAENIIRASVNYLREGAASLEGVYPLDSFGGDEWWAKYSGGDLSIEDVTTDPLTIPRTESYVSLNVKSFAVQPYRRAGAWTAILAVTEDRPRKWSPEELALLDNVAARVWPLVEQARGMEENRRNQVRLALVAETGRLILESNEPESLLKDIYEMTADHLDAEVSLMLVPGDGSRLSRVEFFEGVSERTIEQIQSIYFGESGGATDDSDEAGFADIRAEISKALVDEGIVGSSIHTLLMGDQVLGVMIFASRKRGDFSDSEVEFLETMCGYMTGAYMRFKLLENLREADRRKDRFLATLAHELRNPLAPILTGLEIMKRSQDDPVALSKIMKIMERQTGQMVHLIDDLLDMSRINTGKIVLKKYRVPLLQILQSAIEASQPLLDERKHAVSLDLPDASVMVEVDPSRLSQVVSNLLSNAAKYTPQGGRIELSTSLDRDEVSITVRDNGIGIEAPDQQLIFELFQQSSNGSADGLGIGLTLVKSLVELHDGSVEVTSAGSGKGSEFRVTFPHCIVSSSAGLFSQFLEKETSPALKKVLVVDDGKNAADMLALFFRMEGAEVEVAYDGREGLEKARAFDPDLVIMDVGMPVMDGLEAARLMKADQLKAKLIALSGWGRDEDKKRTTEAGFDHHLVKPVRPDDLRVIISRFLPDAGK